MTFILISILLILEVVIISVALLLKPEVVGNIYWLSTGWICVLVAANWAASALIFSGKNKEGKSSETGTLFGALPSINVILLIYSFSSVALLFSTSIFGVIGWIPQIIVQIIALGFVSIILLLIVLSSKAAQHGGMTSISKSDFLNEVRRIKRIASSQNIKSAADEMLNHISSRLPHFAQIDQLQIAALHSQLKNVHADDEDEVLLLFNQINKL